MSLTRTVRGVVRGGRVELPEKLEIADGTEVAVTVPDRALNKTGRPIAFGMFPGPPFTPDEVLKEVKGLWEREWERSWARRENS